MNGIDRFADRITRAKNLLLDGHTDLFNYQKIEVDFKEKIKILSKQIELCSYQQLVITNKMSAAPFTRWSV